MTDEELQLRSVACKYCARLKEEDYIKDEMTRCFRYSTCTNPEDRCSRFILTVPEMMAGLALPSGYKEMDGKIYRPDGTIVFSLNDAPELKAKIESQERKSNEGCYIATCVYGSYDCSSVWVLRRFRDEVLRKSIIGKLLVSIYYFTSPSLVRRFGDKQWFCRTWKFLLDRLVKRLINMGISDNSYTDK